MLLRVEITGEPKYETELSFCQVKKQQKLKKIMQKNELKLHILFCQLKQQ